MKKDKLFTKKEIDYLSNEIKDKVFKPIEKFKATIFLCGAALGDETKLRSKIAQRIDGYKFGYRYDIIYPENIFEELLYGSQKLDLLSLEEILADSVDVLIIIPESPGSFAELGAFANNEKLRSKIICIIDKKYKKHKSFVNQGPVKLIKKTNKKNVLYVDVDNLDAKFQEILTQINRVKKSSTNSKGGLHLLQLENFLLPVIYLLEPIGKETMIDLVESATNNKDNAEDITTAALTMLVKNKRIKISSEGYSLSDKGILYFLDQGKLGTREKNTSRRDKLDEIRLKILNFTNRQKKLKIN